MAVHEMLRSISDRIGSAATVDTVFGEPRVLHDRAIIPVAMVVGGFGAGGGECTMPSEEGHHGNGSGGGGGFAVRPLAFLEVTNERTKLIPVLDVTRVILASIGLLGGTLFMLAKMSRRRR